jgi:hypothetical protein
MSLSPNREQEIMTFEEVQAELDSPIRCINCGWQGKRLDVITVSKHKETCPKCLVTDFLLTNEELDQMHRLEELCPF